MESDMTERVARALQEFYGGPPPIQAARAAIEAMREPTETMLHAHLDVAPQMWADVYRSMIDAALSAPSQGASA